MVTFHVQEVFFVAFQTVFKRYELKYMLTEAQKAAMLAAMSPYMSPDRYGRSSIRNLYYDTDSYLLIRRSIEKPVYKEKLRIRSYGRAAPDGTVFVELKKKYKHVVYKRRLALTEQDATAWLAGTRPCPVRSQISAEIDYFLQHYGTLHPTAYLSYMRQAYYAEDGSDLRVTFDDSVLCRRQALSLCAEDGGTPLLPAGYTLMEIKCSGGMPLWLVHTLSAQRICKTSYSKYGTAYKTLIHPQLRAACAPTKEEITHA